MTPPDLYGRPRPDRMYRLLEPVVAAHLWLSRRGVRGFRPPRPVDRDLPVRVVDRRAEADGVVSLRFAARRGALPPWRPGCHVDVVLPSGQVRQYSLCGDPGEDTYRIAVRLVGAGSREVHTALGVGTDLVLRGPRTAFPLVGPGPFLFIAGGIGITPLLPMLRTTADWRLLYAGRSRATMPFLDELAQHGPRVRVIEGQPDVPALLAGVAPHTQVYACGPPPLVDAVRAAWPGPLHSERFSPPPLVDAEPFTVRLGRSGPVIPVSGTETALTAVLRERPLRYSCRQGFCGTCRVGVLDSDVDSMLLCTDRPAGETTLDL
ncbi:PDR/VanB family oxidoreductase [Actinokineospora bangkokensis]|uniref:FAD-binding FR-type domain-containing protein n=1 Tax=Actinokineospora bangkokensis TaxID=1193682 RepID=A0A1Q9LDB0_9PSEU|nr:PDR/VanB family oxidoreductase [Actinokineospora bangkokensis]OLR90021.1 hypothetical protein BJP25_03315 [Actinokineospora bangkokensis]